MNILIPDFDTEKGLFDYLIANKDRILTAKKSIYTDSDACKSGFALEFPMSVIDDAAKAAANTAALLDQQVLNVKAVINTCNFLDSHGDVHLRSIWNKCLKENETFYLLENHMADYDHVISDEAKAYVQDMTWKELGYPYEGKTQALIFKAAVDKEENPKMHGKYAKGKVKNHSVRMRYYKVDMAINHKEYKDEYAVWEEVYPLIANKAAADMRKYFFAVREGGIVEGSAVLIGSNPATPTQSVKSTLDEPVTEPLGEKSVYEYMSNRLNH